MSTPARHPSEDALERLEMGLLGGSRERELREHLASCEGCQRRAQAFAAERQELAGRTDPGVFARRVLARAERRAPERSPWRGWASLGALLVPAAALGLFLALRPPSPAPESYLGVKGAVRLEAFSGATGGKLADGAVVHPGEALRFAYGAPRAGYALVLGLSEHGELFAYHPLQGQASAPAAAGGAVLLDGSVILDEVLGKERFYLVFTDKPLQVEDVRAAVRAAHTDYRSPSLPVLADQASLLLEKVK